VSTTVNRLLIVLTLALATNRRAASISSQPITGELARPHLLDNKLINRTFIFTPSEVVPIGCAVLNRAVK
jgi:hypothetical protein